MARGATWPVWPLPSSYDAARRVRRSALRLRATSKPATRRRSPSQRAGARRILWRALGADAHRHDQNTHTNGTPVSRILPARIVLPFPLNNRQALDRTGRSGLVAARPAGIPAARPAPRPTRRAQFPHPPAAPFPRTPLPCDPPVIASIGGRGSPRDTAQWGGCGAPKRHGARPSGIVPLVEATTPHSVCPPLGLCSPDYGGAARWHGGGPAPGRARGPAMLLQGGSAP